MIRSLLIQLFPLLLLPTTSTGQSLEVMVGHEQIFVDLQWFNYLGKKYDWSVFSRTRSTLDYDNNSDLFTGTYLNYSTPGGLGGTLIGKIGSNGGGFDAGIHLLKVSETLTNFILVSTGIKDQLEYSWFSITRFTPDLNEHTKLYSSLEFFTLFQQGKHQVSIQRIRLGLQIGSVAFGGAINLSEVGSEWSRNDNLGFFFRKSF